MPSATSRPIEPVEIAAMSSAGVDPSRMIEPLPKLRSICASADSSAFCLSMPRLSEKSTTGEFMSGLLFHSCRIAAIGVPFTPCSLTHHGGKTGTLQFKSFASGKGFHAEVNGG